MKKELNISEILKGKPKGVRLYSPIFSDCTFSFIQGVTDAICVITNNNREFFDYKGLYSPIGECLLFPSKLMRDWSKFAWKRGDVLATEDGSTKVIFECFEDDTYLTFKGKYCLQKTNIDETFIVDTNGNLTECFSLQAKNIAQIYLYNIEDRIGGRLNMETLEIEKPKKKNKRKKSKVQLSFKPFDKVLVRDSASDKWRASLFGYIGKDGYYCCVYANWIYCIPYEGNEHLLGTTKDVEE